MIVVQRRMAPWYQFDFIFNRSSFGKIYNENLKILNGLTDSIIEEKIAIKRGQNQNQTNQKSKRTAFLDLLLDEHFKDSNQLSLLDIRWEVNTFIFEGHDTTAAAITFAFHAIGLNPDVQQKIHDELDTITLDGELDLEGLKKLKYLDCVVKETLRLYPSVPMIGRVVKSDVLILGDKKIPKGTEVVLWIYGLHRDPDAFPEPEVFRPERFEDHRVTRNPFVYTPFSGGPRNCIGQKFANMELKCILATVLQKFTIKSIDSVEDIKIRPEIILNPMSKIRMKFEQRF